VQGICLAGTDARRRGLHHRNVTEVTVLGWVAAAEDGRHGEIATLAIPSEVVRSGSEAQAPGRRPVEGNVFFS
jgi:hypothetical protein